MIRTGRWILVGSLVSILMMEGLGLAMGKKVEKEEATTQVEEKQIEVQQKQVEAEQKGKEKVKVAVTKDVKSEIIEPKLIWSKEFNQIVRDVVISGPVEKVATETEALGAPAKMVFSTKVVVTEDKIKFLNDEGIPEKGVEIPSVGSVVKITQNGEYIGFRPMKRGEKGLIMEGAFQLFNNNGKVVWESDEVEPTFELSEDGQTIVSQSVWESGELVNLIFLNSKGLKKAVKPLSKECAFYNLSFSEDGNYLGIAIGEDQAWLILYDKEGNELWRRYLGDNVYNTELAISRRGNYIAIIMAPWGDTGKRYLLMYNLAGIQLWEKEVDFVGSYAMSFSANERYFILGSSGGKGRNKIYRGTLWLYEVEKGNVLWKYGNESNNRAFFFTEFSPDNKFLLAVGVNTNPFALLFSLDGEKLWESEYSEKGYYDWEEKLNNGFLDSRKFRVVTKQGVYVYEILSEMKGGK